MVKHSRFAKTAKVFPLECFDVYGTTTTTTTTTTVYSAHLMRGDFHRCGLWIETSIETN